MLDGEQLIIIYLTPKYFNLCSLGDAANVIANTGVESLVPEAMVKAPELLTLEHPVYSATPQYNIEYH